MQILFQLLLKVVTQKGAHNVRYKPEVGLLVG